MFILFRLIRQIPMESYIQDLVQELECPICLEYMIPPITVCENGHSICNSCKPGLDKCPNCRGNLMAAINRPMENLSQQITHPCKNRDYGCAVHVLLDFKEQHEKECTLSPRNCPLYGLIFDFLGPWLRIPSDFKCSWIGLHSALGTHLENDHYALDHIPSQLYLSIDEANCFLFYIDGNLFYCFSRAVNSCLRVMVMFLGSPEKANNYKYKVTIKTQDDEQFMSILIRQVPMGKFLKKLACPICYEYMIPPITVCLNGHSICNSCKPRLDKCPSCRGNFANVRNILLEKLSETITHPCKNRKNGCAVHVLVDFKEQHEKECSLSPCKCPLNDFKLPCMVQIPGYILIRQIAMESFVQDLLRELECPLCCEYMIPPITSCVNGHNICNFCKPGLDKCPNCRGNLMDTRIRPMENLSQQITHPCKNRKDGCAVHVLLDFKKQHEKECTLSPRQCPLYDVKLSWIDPNCEVSCHWKGPPSLIRQIPMESFVQDLLRELECPLCCEYMIPPITSCVNGHNICNFCKPGLDKCPNCRGNLMDTRNRPMENLSQQITHPCKNREYGCAVHVLVDYKEQHEKECTLSLCKCPLHDFKLRWLDPNCEVSCDWVGPPLALQTHLQNVHKALFHIPSKLNVPMDKKKVTLFFIYDKFFFSCSKPTETSFQFVVSLLGSQEEANNYKYKATVKTQDGEQFISICLTCPSLVDTMAVYNSNLDGYIAEFSKLHCKKFITVVEGTPRLTLNLEIIKSART
ncbi:hypothetical protein C0J52_23649 [Blattella germanica]|nr:hypothetical protein C0J52_23649 [Blattella germanica]